MSEVHLPAYRPRSKGALPRCVAANVPDGADINLTTAEPTLVANHSEHGKDAILHRMNAILGMGLAPFKGQEVYDLINAGKQPVAFLNRLPGPVCPRVS